MLFKTSIKLYFLLSIITIFALNLVHAKKSKESKVNNDKFYIVITENGSGNGKSKREEKEQFLDALVTEINSLIIGNKDTYDDPSMLKKLEEAPAPETPFTKRSDVKDKKEDKDDNEDDDDDDGEVEAEEHKFAYVVSSLEKESLISSYLSEELVPLVKDLPSVKAVLPDFELEFSSNKSNNLKEVKNECGWEHSCVNGNVYNHLSLISQGKYDSYNTTAYDKNYYYPSSAGEGITIFVLDTGFNFNHDEFSNRSTNNKKNERITTCIASARYEKLYSELRDMCSDVYDEGHGNIVSGIAGGLTNGVASKANIYGIAILATEHDKQKASILSLIDGLEIINKYFLSSEKFIHKSVINLSCGYYFSEEEKVKNKDKKKATDYLEYLIKEMSNKGSVFVSSAGNEAQNVDNFFYPCTFDDVICVGSTDNIGINDDYYALEEISKYRNNRTAYPDYNKWEELYDEADCRLAVNEIKYFERKYAVPESYRRAYFSNYGKKVDIYAPGFINAIFRDKWEKEQDVRCNGTSFSTPIVSGVAATIMSENPSENYTTSKMRDILYKIGLKDVLKDVKVKSPNVFVNNGKHLIFDYEKDEGNDDELKCSSHGCCLN